MHTYAYIYIYIYTHTYMHIPTVGRNSLYDCGKKKRYGSTSPLGIHQRGVQSEGGTVDGCSIA